MGYTVEENTNKLKILLKYNKGEPAIKKIKCVSKPGSRIFYSVRQLWKIKSSKSFLILSTNEGLKTLTESKRLNLGGEPFIVIL